MMKKITFFLLGALLATVVPGNGLRAQNVQLHINASSLDRAALASATIYAAAPGQAYYLDAAQLDPSMAGSAVLVNSTNLPVSTDLTLVDAGRNSYFTGTVDSTTYAMAFIVVRDAAGRAYVVADANRQQLNNGYFYCYNLFYSAVAGSYTSSVAFNNVVGNISAPVVDSQFYFYSSLDQALNLCGDSAVLYFLDTIRLASPLTIGNAVKIYQSSAPLVSTYTGASPLITVNNTEVSWFGTNAGNDIQVAGTGDLFDVNNSTFNLRQFAATPAGHTAVGRGNSTMTFAGCTLGSSADVAAVSLRDGANASLSTVSFSGSTMAELDVNATGCLTVYDSTAAANATALDADAYFKAGNYRKYSRTLTLVAAAANDTIFMVHDSPASRVDTIASGAVVDFGGNTVQGTLYIDNSSDTVFLQNGRVKDLNGTATATGTLCINNLDSVNSLNAAGLDVEIRNGRFVTVTPATGANVTIKGGKYGQSLRNYLAPRYTMGANTDADSVTFPYKVGAGYTVVFKNYNGRGQDSSSVINTEDNRIVPAPSLPTYVGADTLFSAYFTDSLYTTPWSFLNDVLTSDTMLWAKWYTYNSATEIRYVVYHHRQALDGSYPMSLCDSTLGVSTKNAPLTIYPNIYAGFTPNHDSIVFPVIDTDLVQHINYVRDTFTVYYHTNGGTMPSGYADSARFLYGETVVYPTPVFAGHTFASWTPVLTTMPAYNFITSATYITNTYPLTWTNANSTVIYNGNAVTSVTATYVDDNGDTVNAILSYADSYANPVSEARTAGSYVITAAPVDPNYTLVGSLTTSLTIAPAQVSVSGISVEAEKIYDGNANAVVTSNGTPVPHYGNDDVSVNVNAQFNDASVAENKTITAYLTLTGVDAYNYTLISTSQVVTNSGAIVAPMDLDPTQGNSGNGIDVSAAGYCSGDATGFGYYLATGSATPDQVKIEYSTDAQNQGFVDVNWTSITTPGTVSVDIPVNAAAGNYNAWLTFRNSAHPQFESARTPVTFHVNLSRLYIQPIFSDVISIVDSCQCIDHSSVKWYHNGVYVGDGPYYQEPGGLTGTYHATLTMNGVSQVTCEQTDVTTLVSEDAAAPATVNVYPNPVADRVTVSIENASHYNHTLQVMNVLGMTLVNTVFDGDETTIDFSGFGVGTYTISVDGMVVRVIKK